MVVREGDVEEASFRSWERTALNRARFQASTFQADFELRVKIGFEEDAEGNKGGPRGGDGESFGDLFSRLVFWPRGLKVSRPILKVSKCGSDTLKEL